MRGRLRVCFVAGTLGLGGAERQLFYMVKALTEHGVVCRVLSLTRGEPYESRIVDLGVPVIWVGQSPSRLARLFQIISEVREFRPHVVQSAHSFTSLYAIVSANVNRCVGISAIRKHGLDEFMEMGGIGVITLLLSKNLIGNSRQAILSIQERYQKKRLYFLDNVVDTSYFKPNQDRQSTTSSLYVLNVGRLFAQKRQDIFLRVFAQINRTHSRTRATLVGDGPLYEGLCNLVSELRLTGCVELARANKAIIDAYNSSDIFVLTSDYEGTPNVVLEAMACGLPVVATRAGATSDLVIDGETGFLADCGDVDALAQHIIRLLDDADLRQRMGKTGRQRVVESYSLDSLYNNLISIYDQLLTDKQMN